MFIVDAYASSRYVIPWKSSHCAPLHTCPVRQEAIYKIYRVQRHTLTDALSNCGNSCNPFGASQNDKFKREVVRW